MNLLDLYYGFQQVLVISDISSHGDDQTASCQMPLNVYIVMAAHASWNLQHTVGRRNLVPGFNQRPAMSYTSYYDDIYVTR